MVQFHREATELSVVANRIAVASREILDCGGSLDVQSQMNFVTSLYARMVKDWGVIEHMQQTTKGLRAHPTLVDRNQW
jgi:hypothetical protein